MTTRHGASVEPPEPTRRPQGLRLFDALVPVAIAIIVLLVGFIQRSIPLTWSVITAGIGLAVMSGGLGYAGAYLCFHRLAAELTSIARAATTSRATLMGPRSVVFDGREILEYERSVECEEVWIVSSDMHMDAPDTGAELDSRPTVRYNIKSRGMRYVFIVPDQIVIKRKITQRLLAGLTAREKRSIQVVYLPASDFGRMPYLDGNIAIYNPTRRPITTPLLVAFELYRSAAWCTLPESIGDRWVARICEIASDLNDPSSAIGAAWPPEAQTSGIE